MSEPHPTGDYSLQRIAVQIGAAARWHAEADCVAVEEPLEIQLGFGPAANRSRRTLSITMRTPGHDGELAIGWLLAEGVVQSIADVLQIDHVSENRIRVQLQPGIMVDTDRLARIGYTTSSCGLCGRTTLDALETTTDPLPQGPSVAAELIANLPTLLQHSQPTFARTGGLHAVGLFSTTGELLAAREDVGRHNAADKVIGWAATHDTQRIGQILCVSARASFELVQKAIVARVPIFVAVGAPSSLAVQLAVRMNLTLVGFARENRFNIYSAESRILRPTLQGTAP